MCNGYVASRSGDGFGQSIQVKLGVIECTGDYCRRLLAVDHFVGFAERNSLNPVQPVLAVQNVAHAGSAQPHFPGKFLLGQTRVCADLPDHFQQ